MFVPVNLYVDRMSPVQPVRVADVYAVTQNRATAYREAAAKIGLTAAEYVEFRDDLTEGNVTYGVLPQHIDAMAGIHRRNGRVYALRNVQVPRGTMGWRISLADGTTVLVPQICGNLSMNRSRPPIAQRMAPTAHHITPAAPVLTTRAVTPIPVAVTPVTFVAPAPPIVAAPIVAAAPLGAAPVGAAPAAAHAGSFLPFLAPLVPILISLGSDHSSPAAPLPLCSAGSNELGVCRR